MKKITVLGYAVLCVFLAGCATVADIPAATSTVSQAEITPTATTKPFPTPSPALSPTPSPVAPATTEATVQTKAPVAVATPQPAAQTTAPATSTPAPVVETPAPEKTPTPTKDIRPDLCVQINTEIKAKRKALESRQIELAGIMRDIGSKGGRRSSYYRQFADKYDANAASLDRLNTLSGQVDAGKSLESLVAIANEVSGITVQ